MSDEGRERADHEGRVGRHRSDDPQPIDPPRLRDELRDNFRTVFLIPLISLVLIGWGVDAAMDRRGGATSQWFGVGAIGAGQLFAVSFWLYFKPGPRAKDHWQRNPGKRRSVFVLRHAWTLALIGSAVVWLVDRFRA